MSASETVSASPSAWASGGLLTRRECFSIQFRGIWRGNERLAAKKHQRHTSIDSRRSPKQGQPTPTQDGKRTYSIARKADVSSFFQTATYVARATLVKTRHTRTHARTPPPYRFVLSLNPLQVLPLPDVVGRQAGLHHLVVRVPGRLVPRPLPVNPPTKTKQKTPKGKEKGFAGCFEGALQNEERCRETIRPRVTMMFFWHRFESPG